MKVQLSILFSLLFCAGIWAQPKQNSPYSRYGLGDPINQFFASQAGFGGQAVAYHDPFHLNLVNPASYAFLRATTFEGGMYAKYSDYQSSAASLGNWSGNMAYLAIGFPLRSPINEVLDRRKSSWHFGMGAALTPNTVVGYKIFSLDTLPDLGALENDFEGNGGTYRFTWSNAAKYKNTAFGVNLGWIFGKNVYESTTAFADSLPTFRSTRREDIRLGGLTWNAGVQHDFILKYSENDKSLATRWLTVGITGEGSNNIRSTADNLFVRHRGRSPNGQFDSGDTLLFETGTKRTLSLPAALRVGVQYVMANKLRVGAQYAYEGWSVFRNEARANDAEFRNTTSISAGVEYIPDHISYNNYGKRIRYRAGAYLRQDPRVVNGQKLDDIGISLGLGFPIILPRQQTSFINTALEIGRLGTDSPIQETYFRLTAGFTFNDNSWFYKRRFE